MCAGREEKYSSDGRPREKRKKRRSNTTTTCPFLKQGTLENFRDLALAEVQDIEQLVGLGRQLGACPYYGVRHTIPSAQLVVLPYNTLLHAGTREALGLRLKGNIVIIDEAHNLLDVINSVHSVEISGAHVTKALSQLSQYKLRYKSRLKAKNLMYVNHILDILNCLLRAVSDSNKSEKGNKSATPEADVRLLRLNDFLFTSGLDNINLFKVLRYCKRSEIAKKLNGFVDRFFDHHLLPDLAQVGQGQVEGSGRSQGVAVASGDDRQMRSPLMIIESFLSALTSADKDGRIVVTKSARVTLSRLKFLLLNPAVHFAPILHECRAVVMTGGTMQPVSEFKDQLLYSVGVSPSRVIEFSCGHVIPADNLLPMALSRGPSGVTFDFTYQTRDTAALMDELGRAILNLCNVVPGGVVCFLPSYEYEKRLYTHWTTTGCLDKINSKKKVFREPKMASQVETVLTQYSRCIEFNRGCGGVGGLSGALLLSVVGGKLSEGINFSDDLGRCVVMVGLPYPNIKSPELAEKMQYLNSTLPRDPGGKLPGQIHYENLCMKAVNQSIGRSIRHSRDYACIVLADQRYSRPSVRSKLPQWISSQLVVCESFGPAFSSLRKFFNEKKKKT
jgi:chromosome transmission fidelity protein 1